MLGVAVALDQENIADSVGSTVKGVNESLKFSREFRLATLLIALSREKSHTGQITAATSRIVFSVETEFYLPPPRTPSEFVKPTLLTTYKKLKISLEVSASNKAAHQSS